MAKKSPPAPFLSLQEFHNAIKGAEGHQIADPRVRHSFDTEVKASEEEGSRVLNFSISSANVDRMGDTIALDGWSLDNFRKNPVVLFGHNSSAPPVAKSNHVWTENERLKADAEFVPADNPAVGRFAEGIFQLYKGGFMSATSVGFAPKRYAYADRKDGGWGIDFMEQELLEFSLVPIPANADALIEGRSAGIDVEPVLEFCEEVYLRAADDGRVMKLVESILGGNGRDLVALSFAEKIASQHGKGLFSRDRIAAVERAATQERLKKKRERQLQLAALSAPK